MNRRGHGHHHLPDPQLRGVPAAVHRPGTALHEQHEVPGVVAALHRGPPDQVRHLRVGDAVEPAGRLGEAHPQRVRHLLPDRPLRRLPVQPHAPAQEVVGVQEPQHQIDIRDRGLGAAEAVARRPRLGPRPLRPHLHEPLLFVHPADAAAARADGLHPDLGGQDGVAQDHRAVVLFDAPVPHQAHLEGGPAHVGDQDIGLVDLVAEVLAAHHARRRPRLHQAHAPAHARVTVQHPAVGLHDERRIVQSLGRQGLAQGRKDTTRWWGRCRR